MSVGAACSGRGLSSCLAHLPATDPPCYCTPPRVSVSLPVTTSRWVPSAWTASPPPPGVSLKWRSSLTLTPTASSA